MTRLNPEPEPIVGSTGKALMQAFISGLALVAIAGCRNPANDDPSIERLWNERSDSAQTRTQPMGSRQSPAAPTVLPTHEPTVPPKDLGQPQPRTTDQPSIIDKNTDARVRQHLPASRWTSDPDRR